MYDWIYDDKTWCGNECSHTECERHPSNRLNKEGVFSQALFKDTEMCPLFELNYNEETVTKILEDISETYFAFKPKYRIALTVAQAMIQRPAYSPRKEDDLRWYCGLCGKKLNVKKHPSYCWNCGAKIADN